MIRRNAGHDFLLISQNDHAVVAQQLTAQFGNSRFAQPSADVVSAVGLHDSGWPIHDDQPTLNAGGHPLDVFEVPREIALRVWAASADRAAAASPYAGLLVSLHSLSLSIHAGLTPISATETFDVRKMHEQFDINKFQHREIERQEQLRQQLGFNPNLLLKHGLADARASDQDDRLRFDFRLLQAMDVLSLCLCCTNPPMEQTDELLRDPASNPIRLRITKSLDSTLHVSPWPFRINRIQLTVPCRRITGKRFDSVEEFREAYHSANIESISIAIAS